MISTRSELFALVPLALALGGCTGNVDSSASGPDADTKPTALSAAISIEATSYADDATPPHATAIARFIRSQEGADEATLRMLGASIDLPPIGSCAALSVRSGGERGVELVDVGAVTFASGASAGAATSLAPHYVPDVTDLVSGVVYAARAEGEDVRLSGPISINVAGTNDVGPLSINVQNMEAPADVVFDGTAVDTRAPIAIDRNADVVVTWSARDVQRAPSEAARDVVYFEIANGGETLTCAYDDNGSATLAAPLFAEHVPRDPTGDSPGDSRARGTITIHRLHRESAVARGMDDGEVRFDFARVYSFLVQ